MNQHDSPMPRSAINLMFLLTACFWFTQYAITPYINVEMSRMGATASLTGMVGGAYGLTQMLVRIPLGMAADWYGKQKPFIILGCALSALSMVGYLLWYTPTSFVVLRGVAGLASASWVSFTVLFGSYFSHGEGPRRISQLNIFNQLGRLFCYKALSQQVAPARPTDIAIIATPADRAQAQVEALAQGGIKGIWNFAAIDLVAPEGIVVSNIHLTDSLMMLTFRMHEKQVLEENRSWVRE